MVLMTSFPPPTEGLRHVEQNTRAFIGETSHGNGTLYIAEERLAWSSESGQGFSLEYPSISLHAVSRDTTQFPYECLYCMTNISLNAEDKEDNSEDEDSIGEIRFVPNDKTSLEEMYSALCQCQILHPDPEEEMEDRMAGYGEEDEDEDYFCDADEGELTEEGQDTLDRLEGMLNMPSREEFEEMTHIQTNGQGHDDASAQFDDAESS